MRSARNGRDTDGREITEIRISTEGYVDCKSCFYSSKDGLSKYVNYDFSVGLTLLEGEIDTGVWAISYLLSMYACRPKDFILFETEDILTVNGVSAPLSDLLPYTCYMDELYPLFSTKKTVRALIEQGLRKTKSQQTSEEIRMLFELTPERLDRPLSGVGNERVQAMAAIGYCHGKRVFCYPWLSHRRFDTYKVRFAFLSDLFKRLGLIGLLPVGPAAMR